MNIVKEKSVTTVYKVKDLTSALNNRDETAFIGQVGNGPGNSLYLIAYEGLFLASNPCQYWSTKECPVTVHKFVDIEIIVRDKS